MDDRTQAVLTQLAVAHPWLVALIVALPGSAMFLNAAAMVIGKITDFVRVIRGRDMPGPGDPNA